MSKNSFSLKLFIAILLSAPLFSWGAISPYSNELGGVGEELPEQVFYDGRVQVAGKSPNCVKETVADYTKTLRGNVKKFLRKCTRNGVPKFICKGFIKPDAGDANNLICVYGEGADYLVGPQSVWKNGFELGKIIKEVNKTAKICRIDDWFRPTAYNKIVKSSSSRHKNGGAVDIKPCPGQGGKAWKALCQMLNEGKIKGLGRYSSGAMHVDLLKGGNWGGACPKKK